MTKAIILKNISWQTAFQVLANGLGLIFNIILARKISQFEFGAFNYIFSVLAIVGLILQLGIPVYFLRKWSTHASDLQEDFGTFFSARILVAVPISAIMFLYVFLVDRFMSLEFLLAYTYILLEIFSQPARQFFSSQNQFHKTFAIDASERAISLGLGIGLLMAGYPLRAVLIGFIVGRIASIVLCFILIGKTHTFRIDLKKSWWVIKLSLPLFMVSIFSTLYFRIDMLIIRYVLGVEEVGYYSAAYRLLDAGALLPAIVSTATLPTVIALFARKESKTLQRLFNQIVQSLTIASLHIAICGYLYAQPVIQLIYGQKFLDSVPLLQVLSLNAIFLFITYPLAHFMVANHQEKFYLRILVFLFTMNVILNLLLMPIYGTVGAAIATLITECVAILFLLLKSKLTLLVQPLLKIGLAGFTGWIIVAFIPAPWYINVSLQTVIYLAMILILKVINIKDFLPVIQLKI